MSWVVAAFASAFFAGITSILAKCGIKQTDSDVATAIRTCVVLVFAWAMAGISGSIGTIGSIEPRSWLFLVLSGLATGASWICYFKALSIGNVNKVVPVDKMSTVLAALVAIALFDETSNLAVKLVGTAVITLGTFLMIEKKQSAEPEQQQDRTWLAYALGAAVFAALTSVLAKIGIEGVESNLATAIRTSRTHQARFGPAVYQRVSIGANPVAQLLHRGQKCRVIASVGTQVHGDVHICPPHRDARRPL